MEESYYIVIPTILRDDERLNFTDIIIYGDIVSLSRKSGYCYATDEFLANKIRMSDRQVRRTLKKLSEYGYIYIDRNGNKRKIFISDIRTFNRTNMSADTDTDVQTHTDTDVLYSNINNTNIKKSNTLAHSQAKSENKKEDFNKFWNAYPKKRGMGQALKAWNKIKPDNELVGVIMQAVEVAKQSDDWQKQQGQYIPYPATWLNAMGWEDDYEECEYVSERGAMEFG